MRNGKRDRLAVCFNLDAAVVQREKPFPRRLWFPEKDHLETDFLQQVSQDQRIANHDAFSLVANFTFSITHADDSHFAAGLYALS